MEEKTKYVANPCVCCGEEAPEGLQYCGRCKHRAENPDKKPKEDVNDG